MILNLIAGAQSRNGQTAAAQTERQQAASPREPMRLPELAAELSETSVSGVSSGGAMATQMHIAHSAHMRGVGITAGVGYDGADSRQPLPMRVFRGINKCIKGIADKKPDAREVALFSIERTKEALAAGGIDDPVNLKGQRIWLFHGKGDTKIAKQAMDGLRLYYLNYVEPENVFYMDDLDAPHAQVTDDFGDPDQFKHSDHHIIDLDYDTPGRILELIYGSLDENEGKYEIGNLKAFDQTEFVGYTENDVFKPIEPERVGLADTGYVYIPTNYQPGRGRVHVAFHGCDQYADETMEFVRNSGYSQWAEKNNIIVLFPQATATLSPFNPKGCWDWFGFGKPHAHRAEYARKNGYQISAVWRMIERLATGHPQHQPDDAFGPPLHLKGDATDISVALVWERNRAADGFNIYCKGPLDEAFAKINSQPVVGSSYVHRPPLTPGAHYEFYVTAWRKPDIESEPSATIKLETLTTIGEVYHVEADELHK